MNIENEHDTPSRTNLRSYTVTNLTRLALALLATIAVCVGCTSAADRASDNLSNKAENFEIERRVVFMNGITDNYMLEIVGRCSIEDQGNQLEVTCLEGPDQFRKHFLGLSDNVSYFVEQLEPVPVDTYRYKVRFRPESILPDFDLEAADPDDEG